MNLITIIEVTVKDEMLVGSHSILNRWRNQFFQLRMYVHGANDVRQTAIHTAEPLVPGCNAFGDWIITDIRKYIHHHVLTELLQNWLSRR